MRERDDDLTTVDPDSPLAAESGPELRRGLLMAPGYGEAAPTLGEQLLQRHHAEGQPGAYETALVLCTDRRWHRTTSELIARIAAAEVLTTMELDDLAEQFLMPEVGIEIPAEWFADAAAVAPAVRGHAPGRSSSSWRR